MATAMIWGAGGGMGQALVTQLRDADWDVIAMVHNDTSAAAQATHTLETDIASPFDVEVATRRVGELVNAVDLWVYLVGDITSTKVADLAPETWQRIIDANLTGAFLTTHYSLPLLAEDAHLIYVGAISERLRLPGLSAYSAAKSGLEAYVEALGKEERKRKVTLLRPSAVDTPFWEKVPMRLPKNALAPAAVAEKIRAIYADGEQGTVDLL